MAASGLPVPAARVKLNFVNFNKPDSLFNKGMQPVMYSMKNAASKNTGWVRAGTDISYSPNTYPRKSRSGEGEGCYFTLTFTIEFRNVNDTYLLAYTYPYTHTDYTSHVSRILHTPRIDQILRRSRLCKTLGGYDCDLLVITDFTADTGRIGPLTTITASSLPPRRSTTLKSNPTTPKPCLLFSARVHPGEAQSSYMMQGLVDFLTSDTPAAIFIREVFVVFVVPMLNVEGVVFGNTRCGLAGGFLLRHRLW